MFSLFSALRRSSGLLPEPGELCLGAWDAVRRAARHPALGQIQGHGERDEVSHVQRE